LLKLLTKLNPRAEAPVIAYPDEEFVVGPRKCPNGGYEYEDCAKKVVFHNFFTKNFATYEGGVSAEVKAAGPTS
jgi:hypothetical protein